jgi:hypothetical protein
MAETSLYPTALDSTNIYEVVARLSTTLTADITDTTTTIPLTSTAGFPTQGYIVIDNETMKYISVLGPTSVDCTGGRGHAGTAAAHVSTTQILVAVTAAVFNKLRAGLIATQTYLGISGSTDTATITGKFVGLPAQTTNTQVDNLNANYLQGKTAGQYIWAGSTAIAATTAIYASSAGNIVGVSNVSGITAMENEIVITPTGFDLNNQAPATLTEVAGTSVAPRTHYLIVGATNQADAVPFIMPRSYNGQTITVQYMFNAATASVTHDIGIRGIAAGAAEAAAVVYGAPVYVGVQTASATSLNQGLVTKAIIATSLGFAANKICYLGIIGATVTNNVRIKNVKLIWDKG